VSAASIGLCRSCLHVRRVVSVRGSEFFRCLAPQTPKYPPLPVLRCGAYEPAPDGPPKPPEASRP